MTWCSLPGYWIGFDVLERYGCRLADGFLITVQLVGWSFCLGLVFSLPLALMRLKAPWPLRWFLTGYMTLFRGTPLLVQLFLVYYGLGSLRPLWQDLNLWWFFRDPLYCCLLAFTLNTAAYQAEIMRGALQSVPQGLTEAGRALGLSSRVILLKIELPQALMIALRPLGNELVIMVKASALGSLVTLYDLMGATKFAFARSFDLSIYLVAAVIYLALVELIRRLWAYGEQHLTRHLVTHR